MCDVCDNILRLNLSRVSFPDAKCLAVFLTLACLLISRDDNINLSGQKLAVAQKAELLTPVIVFWVYAKCDVSRDICIPQQNGDIMRP